MISHLHIKNFKSIKDLVFQPKKINLLIGFPNVGKSNVLEALSLHCIFQKKKKFMDGFIRYEDIDNLFFENNTDQSIVVVSDSQFSFIFKDQHYPKRFKYNSYYKENVYEQWESFYKKKTSFFKAVDENSYQEILIEEFRNLLSNSTPSSSGNSSELIINMDGIIERDPLEKTKFELILPLRKNDFVKKYSFLPNNDFSQRFDEFLLPPFGLNLYDILDKYDELLHLVKNLLLPYELELVLRVKERKLEV